MAEIGGTSTKKWQIFKMPICHFKSPFWRLETRQTLHPRHGGRTKASAAANLGFVNLTKPSEEPAKRFSRATAAATGMSESRLQPDQFRQVHPVR